MSKLQDALDGLKNVVDRGMEVVDPDAAHREATTKAILALGEKVAELEARFNEPAAAVAPTAATTPSESAAPAPAPAAAGTAEVPVVQAEVIPPA